MNKPKREVKRHLGSYKAKMNYCAIHIHQRSQPSQQSGKGKYDTETDTELRWTERINDEDQWNIQGDALLSLSNNLMTKETRCNNFKPDESPITATMIEQSPDKITIFEETKYDEASFEETKDDEASFEETLENESHVTETMFEQSPAKETIFEESKDDEASFEETKDDEASFAETKYDETSFEETKDDEASSVEETKDDEASFEETKDDEASFEETLENMSSDRKTIHFSEAVTVENALNMSRYNENKLGSRNRWKGKECKHCKKGTFAELVMDSYQMNISTKKTHKAVPEKK